MECYEIENFEMQTYGFEHYLLLDLLQIKFFLIRFSLQKSYAPSSKKDRKSCLKRELV